MTLQAGALGEFESLMRTYLLQKLPHHSRDTPALEASDLQRLATYFFTWLQRQVSVRPRQILVSKEIAQQRFRLSSDEQMGLDLLLGKLTSGQDVRPHLSSSSACGYDGQGRNNPNKQQKDLDRLLGAWGLHHFHLSTGVRSDGWAERSKHVLIARVDRDRVVAVVVVPHGHVNDPLWTVRPDLLNIIATNWTEEEVPLAAAPAGWTLTKTCSPQELLQLRNAGVSILVEVCGRVCMPGAISVDGTPMRASRQAIALVQLLAECERHRSHLTLQAQTAFASQTAAAAPAGVWWETYLDDEGNLHLVWSGVVDVLVPSA